MIKDTTVFVLGAGAHCPYGLPDGQSLTRMIVEACPTRTNQSNSFSEVAFATLSGKVASLRSVLVQFRTRLNNAGHGTIDSFLATHAREPGYAEIGKLAVAEVLLPLEFKTDFTRTGKVDPDRETDQDWLSYLFAHMLIKCQDSPENFVRGNDVIFVTFNYDRTLEHFLAVRLENTYGITPETAVGFVQQMQIIHVYGSLGPYQLSLLNRNPGALDAGIVSEAASTIRLMYEDRAEESAVGSAREAISSAKTVCFLGFGFDADNIARLQLNKRCQGKSVGATRYQVAEGDWSRTVQRMQPSGFNYNAHRAWDCLAFLKETALLPA
jgi:hypothetical protein